MKKTLEYLFSGQSLSYENAYEIMLKITAGTYSNAQIAAFLSCYRARNLTVAELSGFKDALLERSVKVNLGYNDLLDIVGTGGDGKNTFNISTLAAFVVAASGIRVAKHGNYSSSSVCGSSNLLEALGVKFAKESDGLKKQLERAGICFLHAPFLHPGMRHVAPVRKELGIKTFFNILGPLVNPARPKYNIYGVYSLDIFRLYHYLLQSQHHPFRLLYSLDAYDEISLTGPFKIASATEERLVEPHELDLKNVKPKELYGGSSIESAKELAINILKGNGSPSQNNVVAVNAAIAINCANNNQTLIESLTRAKELLLSGEAFKVLKKLL